MIDTFREILNENEIDFIETYTNGESGFWGFTKDRSKEVIVKINENSDEETLEDFEEQLKLNKEV